MAAENDRPGHPELAPLNLADPRLGARVTATSDDFFGACERLIDPAEPRFEAERYDEHGKWMDGWESRRRRDEGHDWCIVELGVTARIDSIDIDTSFFDGNQPVAASLEGRGAGGEDDAWFRLVPRTRLAADCHHPLTVADPRPVRALRLNIFPDGGVARLRAFGEVLPDRSDASDAPVDLAAVERGGRVLACNDQHFGSAHHVLFPGRGTHMGDGWETRRRRTAGHDWLLLRLGHRGVVETVEIDTAHFKGNYPDRAAVLGIDTEDGGAPDDLEELIAEAALRDSPSWAVLVPETELEADRRHELVVDRDAGPITHALLKIFPDGGVSRLRLFGRATVGR